MKHFSVVKALLLLAALCWLAGTQSATAQTLLLKFDAAALNGESLISGHENEIVASSFSTGVAISVSAPTSGPRTTSAPSFSEISIQKNVDRSSPSLSLYCATANHSMTSAIIYVLQTSGGQLKENYRIELTNPIITSVSLGGSTGSTATESITINFTKIKWVYTPLSGTSTNAISADYDLVAGATF